ncbi:MAG: type II toxin-antitoxin system RelE/ParE family toxin [Chitinophagales bacterium]
MDFKYKLHRKAFVDLDEAIAWYNQKGGKRLAAQFFTEYRKLRSKIVENPFQFGEVENGYRQAVFTKFPYTIIFSPSDLEVFVLAVFHTKRNPKDWKSRA